VSSFKPRPLYSREEDYWKSPNKKAECTPQPLWTFRRREKEDMINCVKQDEGERERQT